MSARRITLTAADEKALRVAARRLARATLGDSNDAEHDAAVDLADLVLDVLDAGTFADLVAELGGD